MKPEADQSEIIQFLSLPQNHGGAPVDTITTHASIVFLAGDRAYKLKRAVKYSYLDYSTVELRRGACEAELTLNRRTAPELYLSVSPIVRAANGRLSFDGPGEPVEWVVVMRRFPQDALLSHVAEHGALTEALTIELANRIAAFHTIAELTPGHGGADGVRAVIQINDENLQRSPPLGLSPAEIDSLRDATAAALHKHATLLEERRANGRVRRCHGDLHLGNICLVDGRPSLFDCIEFSDLIACIDVLYDLAFLLMDLRHRGLVRHSGLVLNRYLDLTDNDDGLPTLALFLSLRASVRAHVTATAAAKLDAQAARQQLAEARSYFDLAVDLLRAKPARLIAIGGLSGTGKSSVAAALAGELGSGAGARVLRSDVVRKRLFNVPPEKRLPAEAYSKDVNDRVYAALENRARKILASGTSVILDAVAAQPDERAAFTALAQKASAAFTGIWLEASPATLLARVARRGKDASDATASVLQRQLAYDLGQIDWIRIDADQPRDAVIQDVRKAIQAEAN
ncbi:bifunctional aminoglycoside phosphotransferase/ATP-binding protein [Dongia deserti]|uniref:bifunctional aminoglycoside phosphotransferase/ATP-binding protein n=1 Tax=Dongia deserti TaxID=2268030 RepID=UPI000E658A43|nr:bifunctional aminoglycoside phosphotransferase/ATP-binding protein [Dongia deserti]